MDGVNIWAVLVAAVVSFLVGGVWFSMACFGKTWMREVKLTEEQIANANMKKVFAFAVNGLFEQKSWRYTLISGGYWVVVLTLMGAIIGFWR